jgi:hypothetical protein
MMIPAGTLWFFPKHKAPIWGLSRNNRGQSLDKSPWGMVINDYIYMLYIVGINRPIILFEFPLDG